MNDWIRTRAGLQMAEAIARYLPRITLCLEEISKEWKKDEIDKLRKEHAESYESHKRIRQGLVKEIEDLNAKLEEKNE